MYYEQFEWRQVCLLLLSRGLSRGFETDQIAVKIPKPSGAADETDETENDVELPQTLIRIPVQQARPS